MEQERLFNEMKRLLASGIIGKPFHFMGEAYGPVVLKSKELGVQIRKTEEDVLWIMPLMF